MPVKGVRGFVRGATAAAAALVLLVSAALIGMTTRVHDGSREVAASVESLRLTQQIAIDLLLHSRSRDGVVSRDLADSIRRALGEAEVFVTTEREAGVLRAARTRAADYLAGGVREGPPLEQAYAAISALVAVNVEQAREAEARAAGWSSLADRLGVGGAILVLVAGGALVVWFERRALRPMGLLGDAMARFAAGQREARADERGPDEIRSMALQFNRMADALSQQRAAQTAFLGGIAHDLRSPLAAMRMALELLAIDRSIESATQRIDRQIGRVDRMVGDFLDMTQIEAQRLRVTLAPLDLGELGRDIAEQFGARAPDHPIDLAVPDRPVTVLGDRLRLDQALGNLVSNAAKYSPVGTCVHIDLRVERGEAVIAVRDHGVGLTEADRRALFEPFERASTARDVPGIGLGLYVAAGIVKAHRGTIEVDSAPGRGSTFRIRLPLAASASDELAVRRHRAPRGGHTA